MATAKTKAVRKYNEKAYDRIELKVPKGEKEAIKAFAESKGMSLNSFINAAIQEKMKPTPQPEATKKPAQPVSEKGSSDYPARYLEEEWNDYLRAAKGQHSAEAIADAREGMKGILFPEGQEMAKVTTKPQFICPFTGKKFGSMDNLIRAAIPTVIKMSEVDLARENAKKKKDEELARSAQLMAERKNEHKKDARD